VKELQPIKSLPNTKWEVSCLWLCVAFMHADQKETTSFNISLCSTSFEVFYSWMQKSANNVKECASVIHLMALYHIFSSRKSSIHSKLTGKFALCIQQGTFELKCCLKGSSLFVLKGPTVESCSTNMNCLWKGKFLFLPLSIFFLASK
jgi:hypothetical protein